MTYEQTEVVQSSGVQEMNERLRRRIYEVREYIQKMTFENQKIEEGVISNQYLEREEEITLKRRDVQTHYPTYEGKRHLSSNLEAMVEKMHGRQEESLKRVRRQEEDIQRRNMESRMNMSSMEGRLGSMEGRMRKTGMNSYYSPPARTFYSPNR